MARTAQILTYLSLFDFGIIRLLPREVPFIPGRAQEVQRAARVRRELAETASLILWQTPVIWALTAVLWFSVPAEGERLR